MEFSVSPHNAFYDEKYLYIILIMLVLASIVCFACFFLVKDKKPVEAPKAELEKAPDQVELRRKETLSKLEALDAKYKKKEINFTDFERTSFEDLDEGDLRRLIKDRKFTNRNFYFIMRKILDNKANNSAIKYLNIVSEYLVELALRLG